VLLRTPDPPRHCSCWKFDLWAGVLCPCWRTAEQPDFIDRDADRFNESLADQYGVDLRNARRQIVGYPVALPGEIGDIPLHIAPLRAMRDYNDVNGISLLFN
jgi:hypothetical protein